MVTDLIIKHAERMVNPKSDYSGMIKDLKSVGFNNQEAAQIANCIIKRRKRAEKLKGKRCLI